MGLIINEVNGDTIVEQTPSHSTHINTPVETIEVRYRDTERVVVSSSANYAPAGPPGPAGPSAVITSPTQPTETDVLWVGPDHDYFADPLDATGQPVGVVPTAQGDGTWAWAGMTLPDTAAEPEGGGIGGIEGEGSPEGVVSAPPGAVYTDILGTNGAWRWLKTGGTDSTGWVVIDGDTGWLDCTPLVTNASGLYLGWGHKLFIRRVGKIVYMQGLLFGKQAASINVPTGFVIPSGFKPLGFSLEFPIVHGGSPSLSVRGSIPSLTLHRSGSGADWSDGGGYSFNPSWPTDDSWPTSLPGVPA